MEIKPLGKRIVVKQREADEKTSGGIYIPPTAKDAPAEGTVKAIGPEVTEVKVGDQVLFGKYAGTTLNVNKEEVLMMKVDDVLGVIEEDDTVSSAGEGI